MFELKILYLYIKSTIAMLWVAANIRIRTILNKF